MTRNLKSSQQKMGAQALLAMFALKLTYVCLRFATFKSIYVFFGKLLFLAGKTLKVKGPAPPGAVKLVFNYTETSHADKRHIVSTYLKQGLVR